MLFCQRFLWFIFLYCFTFVSVAQITIRVVSVPNNTPPDATLYLVGNFNAWKTGDSLYKMTKETDGTFRFTFRKQEDSLVYKIVRNNSWHTVEGRSNGRAKPNRVIIHKKQTAHTVRIEVESWEDLSGHSLSAYILILLFAAIQGFVLILAINKLQDNNRKANRILSVIVLLVSFALLGRVAVNYRDIFSQTPSIYLVSDIVLFSYAPLFYAYLQELLTIQVRTKSKILPFIPFFIHSLIYAYLLSLPKQIFIDRMVDNDFRIIFASVGFVALCYNMLYWFKSLQILQTYKKNVAQTHSFEQNLTYLNSVFVVQGLCLLAWLFMFLYSGFGWVFGYEYLTITEYSVDAVWILFSAITYCLGYFAMNQPAIFKLSAIVGVYQTSATPISVTYTLPEEQANYITYQNSSKIISPNSQEMVLENKTETSSKSETEITPENKIEIITQNEKETNTSNIINETDKIIPTQIENLAIETPHTENLLLKKEETIYAQPYGTPIIQPLFVPKELKQEHISEKQIDIQAYKQQLEALMLQQKPYLEAQLTLPELALQMKISLHLLSKVINDGYDKNFHDFVNTYRIEEFKNLIVKPQYKHQTILAAALDAGFNSKTAFNRAFKKITNSTPREFLKQQSLGEMKEE